MGFFNFFSKEKKETLDKGLEKTKQGLFDKLKRAVAEMMYVITMMNRTAKTVMTK